MEVQDALTMTQAAERLGITRVTLRRLVREGRLPTLENPLDKREKLIPLQALEQLQSGGVRQWPWPKSIGMLSDPELRSDELEEWLEANWRPE